MKQKTFRCRVCGKVEHPTHWINSMSKLLITRRLCFGCNHWYQNHLEDSEPYTWAIVDGGHYRLLPHTDSYFKGFGGRLFRFKFNDGTIKECDNVWFQGEIDNPYWRKLMPDNAVIL